MLVPLVVLFIVCYLFVEESPNYILFVEGNREECINCLHRIAKINGKTYV